MIIDYHGRRAAPLPPAHFFCWSQVLGPIGCDMTTLGAVRGAFNSDGRCAGDGSPPSAAGRRVRRGREGVEGRGPTPPPLWQGRADQLLTLKKNC